LYGTLTNAPVLIIQGVKNDIRVVRNRSFQTFHRFSFTRKARGDVPKRDEHSGHSSVFFQRCDRHMLPHPAEAVRGFLRRAGNQVVVEGGRQHFDDTLLENTAKVAHQSASFQIGN